MIASASTISARSATLRCNKDVSCSHSVMGKVQLDSARQNMDAFTPRWSNAMIRRWEANQLSWYGRASARSSVPSPMKHGVMAFAPRCPRCRLNVCAP